MKLICCWCHCQIEGDYTNVRTTTNIIRPTLKALCQACYTRIVKESKADGLIVPPRRSYWR